MKKTLLLAALLSPAAIIPFVYHGQNQELISLPPGPTVTLTENVGERPTPTQAYSMEKDVTDGNGQVMSDGQGKSMFIRLKKRTPKPKRQVVHEVKKGLWIGGEK